MVRAPSRTRFTAPIAESSCPVHTGLGAPPWASSARRSARRAVGNWRREGAVRSPDQDSLIDKDVNAGGIVSMFVFAFAGLHHLCTSYERSLIMPNEPRRSADRADFANAYDRWSANYDIDVNATRPRRSSPAALGCTIRGKARGGVGPRDG